MPGDAGIIVRIASPADHDNVSSLLLASYPTLLRGAYEDALLDAVLPAMTAAQPALLESGSYYVAETAAGFVVGCGGWTRERPGDGEVQEGLAHVRHFGVHPEWTRQGIGGAIYARCREDAKKAGVTKFECYSSINGEAFYAALGFERLEVIKVKMINDIDFPSVRMLATI